MKFFSFLTNSRGKINPRAALGLLGSVAAVGLTIGGYQHDVKTYPPERLTFAGLESDDGSYHGSAMDYSDNLGVVASAGDKEGGAKYVNVDNLGAGVGMGSAYQTGGGDNLVGNGRVTDTGKITYGAGENGPDEGGDYSARPSYDYGDGAGTDVYSDGGGAAGAQLAGASMAHASGGSSGSSNSYTPGGSRSGAGSNGNGGRPGAGGTPSAGEGYHMTGSMPGSSVDMTMAGTHSRADFNNGSRDFYAGRSTTRKYGEGLAGLAKHSADIASNVRNENANAQGRVFLNGERAGVGGVNFASPGELSGASDDLAPATIAKAQRGIKNWENDKKAYVKRLAQKRKDLAKRMLILIGVTLGVAVAMNYLIKLGKQIGGIKGFLLILAGWALMGGVSWYAIDIMKRAGKFMQEFKTDAGVIGTLGIGLSATAMAFLTYIGIRALTTGGTAGADMKNLWGKLGLKGALKTLFTEKVRSAAHKVITETKNAATDTTADK